MIRYLEQFGPDVPSELQSFCGSSVFGLKALGPVLSYGTGYDFVEAWEQRDGSGQRTAFVSKYYGSVTVHALSSCDREELALFLDTIGSSALVGPADILSPFANEGETGLVMSLPRGDQLLVRTLPETDDISIVRDGSFRDFYDVVTAANPGYLPAEFPDFLTDISHRVRHGTAHTVVLYEDRTPVSTAAVLVETAQAVFLGGVATLPGKRGRHYASACLKALCDRYPDRPIALMCRPEKQAFYEGFGMRETDRYLERSSSQK